MCSKKQHNIMRKEQQLVSAGFMVSPDQLMVNALVAGFGCIFASHSFVLWGISAGGRCR